jgi:hypothetical protein
MAKWLARSEKKPQTLSLDQLKLTFKPPSDSLALN